MPAGDLVAALVLARDRTTELQEVLDALRGQTRKPDRVLIVSNDGTAAVDALIGRACAAGDVTSVRLERNLGGAGGFSAGIEMLANEQGVDFIWVFDDDAVPARDCLEKLLPEARRNGSESVVGATSADASGELAWPLYPAGSREAVQTVEELRAAGGKQPCPEVETLAWHGLLIPARAVRVVGPPRADLFTWYEDVEYSRRLQRGGYTLRVVPDAGVTHPPPPRLRVLRLPGATLHVPLTSPARTYLMTRNALVVHKGFAGRRFWYADMPAILIKAFAAALAQPGSKVANLRRFVWGPAVDAVRGRMGPPPPNLD